MRVNSSLSLATSERSWDVVVIGAGPAGALAAHQLAKRGLQILLVERKEFPRDKVCGGCLGARAVELLDRVGLSHLLELSSAGRTDTLQFYTRTSTLRLPVPGGRVVCRSEFDRQLVAAAISQGAVFRQRTHAVVEPNLAVGLRRVLLHSEDGQTETVTAKVVLVCDGLSGGALVRLPWMRASPSVGSRLGLGTVLDDAAEFEPDRIHMAVDTPGYVGIVRLPDNRLNIASAIDPVALKGRQPVAAMSNILTACRLPVPENFTSSHVKSTPLLTRRGGQRACERLLLVGDAGGYLEPITGEGMAWAIASAIAAEPLVAEAQRAWRPHHSDQWEQTVGHLVASRQSICRSLARLTRHPRLLSYAMRSLATVPWVVAPLINHLNRLPPRLETLC